MCIPHLPGYANITLSNYGTTTFGIETSEYFTSSAHNLNYSFSLSGSVLSTQSINLTKDNNNLAVS
jgi:hypothetical protein